MTNKVSIENESGNKYFHIMLNIADDDLDVYEYRLLGHYIRICNVYGTGKCWESTRTTATKCKMSVGKVSSTRIALEKKGYLKFVQPKDHNKGDTLMVLVVDKWADNIAKYSSSSDEQTTENTPERSPHEQQRSPHETIKNKLERKKELSAPKAAQDAIPQDNSEADTSKNNSELRIVDKLSSDEYDNFTRILFRQFNLNGARVHDVYHQLRGSISAKKENTKRYEYGQLFRDEPVTLSELKGFPSWYERECEGCALPIAADSLEDWFGKYRQSIKQQADRPQSLFQQKRPTNYAEIMEAQGE